MTAWCFSCFRPWLPIFLLMLMLIYIIYILERKIYIKKTVVNETSNVSINEQMVSVFIFYQIIHFFPTIYFILNMLFCRRTSKRCSSCYKTTRHMQSHISLTINMFCNGHSLIWAVLNHLTYSNNWVQYSFNNSLL